MRKLLAPLLALTTLASCATLQSTTVIKPNASFVLGNNEHGNFTLRLQNVSANDIEVYQAPIAGGKHSSTIVRPGNRARLFVEPNTAVYINNPSSDTANVKLRVKGDLELSMTYRE